MSWTSKTFIIKELPQYMTINTINNHDSPIDKIKSILTLFDGIIDYDDTFNESLDSLTLNSMFIYLKNYSKDTILNLLNRGMKKIVFDTGSEQFIENIDPKYYVRKVALKETSLNNLAPNNKGELLFELSDRQSTVEIELFLSSANVQGINCYLILKDFTEEELQLVKKYELRPLVNVTTTIDVNVIRKWFVNLFFDAKTKLLPVIVQDPSKNILMQAYANKEALSNSISTSKATYFSRSRNKLWVKGETSGNYQQLLTIRYDCDFDSIIYFVEQTGNACHTNSYSCFNTNEFDFTTLYSIIKDRKENPIEKSYTSKILENEKMILDKIQEETLEVVNYKDKENLIWEIGDVLYFLQVLMVNKNITLDEVLGELRKRNVIHVK